jgi:hypothetical protein
MARAMRLNSFSLCQNTRRRVLLSGSRCCRRSATQYNQASEAGFLTPQQQDEFTEKGVMVEQSELRTEIMLMRVCERALSRAGFLVIQSFATPEECEAIKKRANELVTSVNPAELAVFSTTNQVRNRSPSP